MQIRHLGRLENGQSFDTWRRRVLSNHKSIFVNSINNRKIETKNEPGSKNDNGSPEQETAA